jgi:hypothetical protein
MANRTWKYWLCLLLALPLIAWWWRHATSTEVSAPTVTEEPTLTPPRFALTAQPTLTPPPGDQGTPTLAPWGPSLAQTTFAPGDVSDAAIAAFSPETIAMLNRHKYWTAQGLVDRLYDAWLDKKVQGLDVEDTRQQIAWALKGMFMEEY